MIEKRISSSANSLQLISLPTELLIYIASFLDIKSHLNFRLVNAFFEELTQRLFLISIKNIKPKIACSYASSYLVTAKGKIYVWGRNFNGELGLGHNDDIDLPQPLPQLSALSLVAWDSETYALTTDGRIYFWGGKDSDMYTPQIIPRLHNIAYISGCGTSRFAVTKNGITYAWGFNNGQLGLGAPTNSISRPPIVKELKDVIQIASGDWHTLALTKEGRVYSFGLNFHGELGLGHNNDKYTPEIVPGLEDVVHIAVHSATGSSFGSSFAVTREGAVYVWGFINDDLGLQQTQYNTPQLIAELKNIASIVAGRNHTLALTKDGKLYAWGKNKSGQLGLGNTTAISRPQLIPNLDHVIQAAVGWNHSLALTEDGNVYAWGKGKKGQLGVRLGQEENQLSPELIPTFTDINVNGNNKKIIESMAKRKLTKINLEGLEAANTIPCSADTKQALLKALDNYKADLNFFTPIQSKQAQDLKNFIKNECRLLSISTVIQNYSNAAKTYPLLNKHINHDKKFEACLNAMQQIIESSKEKELALRTEFTSWLRK